MAVQMITRTVGITLAITLAAAPAWADHTVRVSVDSYALQANDDSRGNPVVSADGRFVAFESVATNLVPSDTNSACDVFIRDMHTGETTRVSVSSAGVAGNADSGSPSISADGRYVTFFSPADNLVPDDHNNECDVFVHDRQTGQTTRVSVNSASEEGNGHSQTSSISGDGRFVAFASLATNLAPGMEASWTFEIFVHDRNTGETTWVSMGMDGKDTNSYEPSVSADGRYVVFRSSGANLVPGDTNGKQDVFLHDRDTSSTSRASVGSDEQQSNGNSGRPKLAAGGRHVVFESDADNLVDDDTNGEWDIFVRDLDAGRTVRVNVGPDGAEANNLTSQSAISADGRFVAFASLATNLIPGGHACWDDIYVHDLKTHNTTLITYPYTGTYVNHFSEHPGISACGRYVLFDTDASNVVPNDTNGAYDVFMRDRAIENDPNADGFVDLDDYASLSACLTGPDAEQLGYGCGVFDHEPDGDVDLVDMAGFQAAFTGPPPGVPGDLDDDGDVDLADYAVFAACLTGPGVSTPPGGCSPAWFDRADRNADQDVDLHDFADLQPAQFGS